MDDHFHQTGKMVKIGLNTIRMEENHRSMDTEKLGLVAVAFALLIVAVLVGLTWLASGPVWDWLKRSPPLPTTPLDERKTLEPIQVPSKSEEGKG